MSLHVPSNKTDCPGFSPRQLSQRFPDNPFYEMVLPFHSKQPNPSNHSSYFILYCFRHNLRRTQAYKQKLSNDIVESHFQYVEWDRRQDDKSIQVFDRRVDLRYHADHFIQFPEQIGEPFPLFFFQNVILRENDQKHTPET